MARRSAHPATERRPPKASGDLPTAVTLQRAGDPPAAAPRLAAQRRAIAQCFGTAVAPVQRMQVKDTDWNAATSAKVTTGSGQGVGIFDDGAEKVVVKGAQPWGNEVVAISNLMEQVLKPQKGEQPPQQAAYARAVTSKTRVLDANEANDAADTLDQLAPVVPDDPDRKDDVVDSLRRPITVVYSYVPGKDFQDFLDENQAPNADSADKISEKRFFGGRKAREGGSPIARMWTDPGVMYQMGKASAVDIVSGNGDRLLSYFNPKNFRMDDETGTMVFIDNVAKNGQVFLTDAPAFRLTAAMAFNQWVGMAFVQDFIQGNDVGIAALAVGKVRSDLETSVRNADQAFVAQQLLAALPTMQTRFAEGLRAGRGALSQAENRMAQISLGADPAQDAEIRINLLARLIAVRTKLTDYDALRDMAKVHLGIV